MIPQFRAWDKKKERMIEWIDLDFSKDNGEDFIIVFEPTGIVRDAIISPILLQSTGLFDKHGKEIFEYEIVDVRTLEGTIYLRGVVKKVKGGFYIEELYNSKIIPLTDFYFKSYTNTLEIEILGNIYEHKGLLDNDS